jgi:hypothetical protein
MTRNRLIRLKDQTAKAAATAPPLNSYWEYKCASDVLGLLHGQIFLSRDYSSNGDIKEYFILERRVSDYEHQNNVIVGTVKR